MLVLGVVVCSSLPVAFARPGATVGNLPVWIEPNRGQQSSSWGAADAAFVAQSGAWQAAIGRDGALTFTSTTSGESVGVRFPGARVLQAPVPEGRLPGVSSYFHGSDPAKWVTGVPQYARLRYREVYPGIDLVYYGSAEGKLEYDFEIAPAADPDRIRVEFTGIARIERARGGALLLVTASGQAIRQRKPVVYAQPSGRAIEASYRVMDGGKTVRFELAGRAGRGERIVIDPVIEYSTFIGGTAFESAKAIACDNAGFCYLAGEGRSRNGLVGPLQSSGNGGQEVVVVKINPANNTIAYYAVLGGDLDDTANALYVDSSGNAYVAGVTKSMNFPTRNAAQPNPGGSLFADAFAAKISPDGASLIYSTYLGGSGAEECRALAVDRTGAAYVVGSTSSRDSFPTTPGAMQTAFRGSLLQQSTTGYVTKIHPNGNRFVYSTLLGGSRQDDVRAIAVDDSGAATVAGTTTSLDFPVRNAMQPLLASAVSGFITRLHPEGSQPLFSTYFGGPAVNSIDALTLDASGNIVLGGSTTSPGFRTKSAAQPEFGGGRSDGILAKISAPGSEVLWATYLGGSDSDTVTSLAVHRDGSVICAGVTASQNFPLRLSPLSPAGKNDGFVTRISVNGDTLMSSMVLGGSEDDRALGVALDPTSDITYVTGWTGSRDFPIRGGALQTSFGGGMGDMFLMRLLQDAPATALAPSPLIVNTSVLSFNATAGSARPPAPLSVQVTSALQGQVVPFTVEWGVTGSGNWLSASPQRGETPATVNVFVNPATLTPGTYQGFVRLVPTSGGGNPISVGVSFQILNPSAEITSLSPSWLPEGTGDTEITLRGRGFAQGASIQMKPENANGVLVVSPTNLTATAVTFVAPRSVLFRDGSFELRVANPDADPSNPVSLLIGGRAIQVAPNAVLHAATGAPAPVSPGQMVLITGAGLGPGELTRYDSYAASALAGSGPSNSLPTKLSETRVLFDGVAAPLVFVWDRQICVMVPYGVAGAATVDVTVEYRANRSNPITVPIAPTQPGIFTVDSWVYGYGTIWNEGGAENSASAPARRGSAISFVMTGAGLSGSPQPDGRINVPPFNTPAAPVTVYIDGQEAELVQASDAPGQVSGLVLVRARVPQGAKSGEVTLSVKAGDLTSPPVKLIVE